MEYYAFYGFRPWSKCGFRANFLIFFVSYRKKSIDTTWSTMRFMVLDHGVNVVLGTIFWFRSIQATGRFTWVTSPLLAS